MLLLCSCRNVACAHSELSPGVYIQESPNDDCCDDCVLPLHLLLLHPAHFPVLSWQEDPEEAGHAEILGEGGGEIFKAFYVCATPHREQIGLVEPLL